MLWRVALFTGHLHPDFIRDKLTTKQVAELCWYHMRHPFGYDVDHLMMAQIAAAFQGGSVEKFLPKMEETVDAAEWGMGLPGISDFLQKEGYE